MQLLDLPVALLTCILQHVPLQDRLGVCTLVCRSFHAAAVAATNSISIMSKSSQPKCHQLAEWLQRHGAGLTALEAQYRRGHGPCLASLPCPLLRDLSLNGCSLQPGCFKACTSLTRLLLAGCTMEGSQNASSSVVSNPLRQLSVLHSLQHLGLRAVRAASSPTNAEATTPKLPRRLLSQLVQLTYLHLGRSQVQSLKHLSALSALQHLDLNLHSWKHQRLAAAALTGLHHLTALVLSCVPWAINLHSMPAITALTALRVLELSLCTSVDPAVLAGFSQLQELEMLCREAWDAEGSAALLAAIGRQPQLTRLAIHTNSSWCPPSAAAYSALTASSHLQDLELTRCHLPVGAWQQMFPPTRCLPELSYLSLYALEGWVDEENGGETQQLSSADTQAMISCCPALASLQLGSQLAVSAAAPLQQLTGLARLSMYAPFQDNAPSIAGLAGLQRLALHSNKPGDLVTVSGLLQLTVLQQLQYIVVAGAACDPGLASPEGEPGRVNIFNKAPDGAPPDVWLQLKECCEAAQQAQAG